LYPKIGRAPTVPGILRALRSSRKHNSLERSISCYMEKPTFDPGLTQQYTGVLKRAINKDGQFNVRRTGITWRDVHPYLFLINLPFPSFLGLVTVAYVVVNTFFAFMYLAIGTEYIKGTDAPTEWLRFVYAFF